MLSDTLTEGLDAYRIGPKVRALRKAKKLGLAQLGDHTGLSPGMLSKIERGQLFPTLPTLLRIAMVFGVGLDHFFSGERDGPLVEIVRKKDRIGLPNTSEGEPSYHFESLVFPVTDRQLEAYVAEFHAPDGEPQTHAHDGVELVYVTSGTLALTIGGTTSRLEEGDSIYFESSAEHSYERSGKTPCSAVVVVLPG